MCCYLYYFKYILESKASSESENQSSESAVKPDDSQDTDQQSKGIYFNSWLSYVLHVACCGNISCRIYSCCIFQFKYFICMFVWNTTILYFCENKYFWLCIFSYNKKKMLYFNQNNCSVFIISMAFIQNLYSTLCYYSFVNIFISICWCNNCNKISLQLIFINILYIKKSYFTHIFIWILLKFFDFICLIKFQIIIFKS